MEVALRYKLLVHYLHCLHCSGWQKLAGFRRTQKTTSILLLPICNKNGVLRVLPNKNMGRKKCFFFTVSLDRKEGSGEVGPLGPGRK